METERIEGSRQKAERTANDEMLKRVQHDETKEDWIPAFAPKVRGQAGMTA